MFKANMMTPKFAFPLACHTKYEQALDMVHICTSESSTFSGTFPYPIVIWYTSFFLWWKEKVSTLYFQHKIQVTGTFFQPVHCFSISICGTSTISLPLYSINKSVPTSLVGHLLWGHQDQTWNNFTMQLWQLDYITLTASHWWSHQTMPLAQIMLQ